MENISKAQKQLKDPNCQHPESSRIDLTNGKGFHCNHCGANVHEKEKKGENETEKISVSSSPAVRYKVQKASGKGNKWQVWDSVENKAVTQDGIEKFTKKNADRICDEKNGTTVDSVPRESGDNGKAIAKRQREMELKAAEKAASSIAEGWKQLHELDEQHVVLHKKASEVIAEMNVQVKTVLRWFARKESHEKLFGKYAVQEEWTQAAFGMTVNGVKYHFKTPKEQSLLPEKTDTPKTDAPPLPEISEQEGTSTPSAAEGEQKPTLAESLADTKPSFAIGVSPADVVSNSVKENSRLILAYARSFGKLMTESEWQECVREVIKGLQYELPDEPAVQVTMNIVPTERESASA